VLGVTTDTILVDRPADAITPSDLEVVTSPLTISGRALAFEGNVNVRVVQVRNGTVRQLGTGHVTGGGDVMRPFTGKIAFTAPSTQTGWVLASELSAYNGAVTKVTAVRVAFTHLPGQLRKQACPRPLNPQHRDGAAWRPSGRSRRRPTRSTGTGR